MKMRKAEAGAGGGGGCQELGFRRILSSQLNTYKSGVGNKVLGRGYKFTILSLYAILKAVRMVEVIKRICIPHSYMRTKRQGIPASGR